MIERLNVMRWKWEIVFGVLLSVGCSAELVEEATFACETNEQCGDFLCIQGVCRSHQEACTTYCDTYDTVCGVAENLETEAVFGAVGCQEVCLDYSIDAEVDAGQGDNLQCRLKHLKFAAAGNTQVEKRTNRQTHCQHVLRAPTNWCFDQSLRDDPCQRYCQNIMDGCNVFEVEEQCLQTCSEYPDGGEIEDRRGHTVQCRNTFAALAASGVNPEDNCQRASPKSTVTTCGEGVDLSND